LQPFKQNKDSWNTGAYQAWVNRFGSPSEAAKKLKEEPNKRIGKVIEYMGDVRGKKIANLLGSNGNKAIALALLGVNVSVVDFSSENKKYAMELAEESEVQIQYILSDVLKLPLDLLSNDFDIVYMEQGILHYFHELRPLFRVVHALLRKGGLLVLQDFHPVTTKLITSKGTTANIRKHKVTGDYFDTTLEEKEVAFTKFLPEVSHDCVQKVLLRNWTLGETITSIASEGLYIRNMEELPNQSSDVFDKGVPKSFIIIAEKI